MTKPGLSSSLDISIRLQDTSRLKSIQVVPYDPAWPQIFISEATIIKHALANNVLAIHHIGSTSVPGLSAKPKIDIIAVVKNGKAAIEPLEKSGFTYAGEWNIPLKFGFTKREKHKINLHVFEESHPEIEANILFRDYLKTHLEFKEEYAALKEKLLLNASAHQRSPARLPYYTLRKGNFIRKILKQAGFNLIRILKCTDETEWDAARSFRNKYFFEPNGIIDPYAWTFNHNEHVHLVLYLGTEIIGYAHIQFWPEHRAAIRIIVIDENKRNQNLGSQFLNLCEKWLKHLNIKNIHAESRKTSLGFYLRNNCTEIPFNDPESHKPHPNDILVGKKL